MKKILIAVLMCLSILGCKDETTVQKSSPSIKGVEYILMNTPNDATITLTFSGEDNRYFGKVLNNYFGSYEMQDNGSLHLSGAASTMMAGPRDLMQLEQDYFIKLSKVIGYEISGDILILHLSDGQTLVYKKHAQ
ncbi:MAG: META domain-containing protein [Alphaproteobacteria bacterium]|nr:META domain-containing protein [Alphaproteobacteria bacterium]